MQLIDLNNLKIGLYLNNYKSLYQQKKDFNVKDLFKYFWQWNKLLNTKYWEGPIKDEIPWISFAATDFLQKNLDSTDIVYEYGAGGSTLFLSNIVKKVISVEHDSEWVENLSAIIQQKNLSNIKLTCIKSRKSKENTLLQSNEYFAGYSSTKSLFKEYVDSINQYPDCYFDLVVIDGRARPSCIKQARAKVKPGKYLLLDNSERLHYQLAIDDLLESWQRKTFDGPTPYLEWFTQTSIWQKPLSAILDD
jgi:hypothetical protein